MRIQSHGLVEKSILVATYNNGGSSKAESGYWPGAHEASAREGNRDSSPISSLSVFLKADDAQASLALEPLALSTTSELNVGVLFVSSFYVVQ
jgi:hypothetical protein